MTAIDPGKRWRSIMDRFGLEFAGTSTWPYGSGATAERPILRCMQRVGHDSEAEGGRRGQELGSPGANAHLSHRGATAGLLSLLSLGLALVLSPVTLSLSFVLSLSVGLWLRATPTLIRLLVVVVSVVGLYGAFVVPH